MILMDHGQSRTSNQIGHGPDAHKSIGVPIIEFMDWKAGILDNRSLAGGPGQDRTFKNP
jgi:hypothetical protein